MLKFIVCGALLFINPLVAGFLFLVWFIADLYHTHMNAYKNRLDNFSELILNDNYTVYFKEMELRFSSNNYEYQGENAHPDTLSYHLRRDGLALWHRKYTEKSKSDLEKYYAAQKPSDYDFLDEPSKEEKEYSEFGFIKNEWESLGADGSSKIEPNYQIFLKCL